MKLFVHFNETTLTHLAEARVKDMKEAVDDLSIAVAAIIATGFKPMYRQPLMNNHRMLIGNADLDKLEVLRKIPNVRKVSRADGKKFSEV